MPGRGLAADRGSAQLRLDQSHAHLAISLGDHAERVAKKDRRGDRVQGATAAQRLEALRRRVEARASSDVLNATHADGLGPRRVGRQATDKAGQAPEAGGDGQATLAVGTKEVLKIHLEQIVEGCSTTGMTGAAAAAAPGAVVERARGEEPSQGRIAAGELRCTRDALHEGAAHAPAAVAAAASMDAWHAVDAPS